MYVVSDRLLRALEARLQECAKLPPRDAERAPIAESDGPDSSSLDESVRECPADPHELHEVFGAQKWGGVGWE